MELHQLRSRLVLACLFACHSTLWCQETTIIPFPDPRSAVAVEYFIDRDPGKGKGTAVSLVMGEELLDLGFVVDNLKLSPGGHRLYIRFQDHFSRWGMPITHAFFVLPNGFQTPTSLLGAELFIDDDPGNGKGWPLPNVGGSDLDFGVTLNTATLSAGGHEAYVRFQDSRGGWGAPLRHSFFLLPQFEATSLDWRVRENEQSLSDGNGLLVNDGDHGEMLVETESLESVHPEGSYLVETQIILNESIPWLKAAVPFGFAAPPFPRLLFELSDLIQGGLGSSVVLSLNVTSQEAMVVEHSFDLIEWEVLGVIDPGETELKIQLLPGSRFFRIQSGDLPPLPPIP